MNHCNLSHKPAIILKYELNVNQRRTLCCVKYRKYDENITSIFKPSQSYLHTQVTKIEVVQCFELLITLHVQK